MLLSLFTKDELLLTDDELRPSLNSLVEKFTKFSTKSDHDKDLQEKLQQTASVIGETAANIAQIILDCAHGMYVCTVILFIYPRMVHAEFDCI